MPPRTIHLKMYQITTILIMKESIHFQGGGNESYWTIVWFHSHFLPPIIIWLWGKLNYGHIQHWDIYPFSISIRKIMGIFLSPSKVRTTPLYTSYLSVLWKNTGLPSESYLSLVLMGHSILTNLSWR